MTKTSPAQLACARRYRIKHAEKIKASKKAIRQRDRLILRAKANAYIAAHHEEILAYKRAYNAKNRELLNAKKRQYYAEHVTERRAAASAWRKAHPEQCVDASAARRARQRGPCAERVSISVLYIRDNKTCTLCHAYVKRHEASIDHIVPLSKGGEHTYRNCALVHRRCNSSKKDRRMTQQMRLF